MCHFQSKALLPGNTKRKFLQNDWNHVWLNFVKLYLAQSDIYFYQNIVSPPGEEGPKTSLT